MLYQNNHGLFFVDYHLYYYIFITNTWLNKYMVKQWLNNTWLNMVKQ